MQELIVKPIGKVCVNEAEMYIQLESGFAPGLKGLTEFSHVQVLWWFSFCDNAKMRAQLEMPKPYRSAPGVMGVFATRAPFRPNPVALTSAYITYIDEEQGRIGLAYIDAEDGSPVIDLKPYSPCLDVVRDVQVPDWCAHWPKCMEESAEFDWEAEFI